MGQRDATSTNAVGTYQPLIVVFFAFAIGAIVDRLWAPNPWLMWTIATLALVGWWQCLRRERPVRASCVLLAAVALLGTVRHHSSWHSYAASDVALFATEVGSPICIDAIVLESPRRVAAPPFTPLRAFSVGDRSRCNVQAVRVRDGDKWRSVSGVALLTVDGQLAGLASGDRVRIFGRLNAPRPAHNPGQYDFAQHDRAAGRLAQIWTTYPECVRLLAEHRGSSPSRWLDAMRQSSRQLMQQYIRPDQFGLASTLILGQREQLDIERNEQFLETGTVHVLSVSGLHVGMVAAGVFALMRFGLLPRNLALIAVAVVTVVYALLTDAGAPVTRATTMILIACLALGTGRGHSMFNALAAAALLVAFWSPAELFRTGPQLSFLSVAAIFAIVPRIARLGTTEDPLERLIALGRPWPVRAMRSAGRRLLQALAFSAAIWLVTSPIVLANFHLLSPIAIPLNLLLWAPVAISLLSGLAVIATGWLCAPIAQLCGVCCSWSLTAMDECVALGSRVPGGHFWLPGPAEWWLVGLYSAIVLLLAVPAFRPPTRWCTALLAIWIVCGFATSPRAKTLRSVNPADSGAEELRCTFLAMGHGLSVVLELPDGQVLVYDAGQLGSPTGAANVVANYLWSRGITHIDAVTISHADLDHFSGIPELAERFSIGVVYVSPMMFEEPAASLEALNDSLTRHGIPVQTLKAGDRLRTHAACRIDVLHPTSQGVLGSDNANSLVLSVEYNGRRILLTGDLESPGLDAVIAELPHDCDVLLAPHHGSPRSNPAGFARWSQPEHVIVSGGYDADATVLAAYRQAGAQVLHTAMSGAVTVTIEEGEMRVETFRDLREMPYPAEAISNAP